jgi:hypothetical protein
MGELDPPDLPPRKELDPLEEYVAEVLTRL